MSRATDGDARVIALQAGRATLEIINPVQRRLIDDFEVGRQVSRNIRVAFEVTDVDHAIDIVARAGVELVAPPTETPWRSLDTRVEAPTELPVTFFEEMVTATTEIRGPPRFDVSRGIWLLPVLGDRRHAMERRAAGHPKRHRQRSRVPSAFA